MKRLFLGVVICCVVLLANAQGKELLIDYVYSLEKFSAPENGKAHYLDMSIRNVYNGGKTEPTDVNVQLYLTESQMCYTSAYFSFFQDSSEAFVIQPMNKQIFWYNKSQMQEAEAQTKETTDFQKEIVKSGNIGEVSEIEINKQDYRMISLIPSSAIAEQYRIQELLFYSSKEQKEIKRFKILYNSSGQYKSQEYIYNSFDLDYKTKGQELSVRLRVIDKSGKLNKAYTGYQLIDKRD